MNRQWCDWAQWPSLAEGEVHVWLAHVPGARSRLDELHGLLSADECERVARFKFDSHRERAVIARGLLRLLLSHYTQRNACEFIFAYNPHGKPELPGFGPHFNTSHSGDYVALAFSRAGAVGVDIECIREDWPRYEAIAERHFAPGEIQQLKALPESARTRGFFDLWTRKEAFVKARGVGLFSGLSQFETSLVCENGVRVNEVRADDWWMAALPELPGCAGSVAVNATRCEPRFWKWK